MATTAYICPSCSLEQDTKDGFCRDCGTQVISLRYCDSCGVKARGAEDFCRECGTRLPAITPFKGITTNVTISASTPTPPISDTPAWLKGGDPVPAPAPTPRRSPPVATATRTKDDTPEWLRGADKRVDDSILRPRPAPPVPTARPTPSRSSSTSTSAPVLVRRPTPAPSDSRTRNLQALLGLLFAIVGVITASNSIVPGLILIVIAMVLGGKPLLEMSAEGLHRVVDWIWEDPVLRKRMLDE
jgi:hypothetical protein